jgi:HSP20 family protein
MYTTKYRNYAHPAARVNGVFDDFLTRDFFGGSRTGSTIPASNVKETAENFTIEVAAPGMEKADFTVKLDRDILVISSEKKAEEKIEGVRYTRKEFGYSSFTRSFSLPETVDTEAIAATYEKGILTVVLPKKPEIVKNSNRTIEIS